MDSIRTVFNHVSLLLGVDTFTLVTTFPRRSFTKKDSSLDTLNLMQAELVPNGTFIVQ